MIVKCLSIALLILSLIGGSIWFGWQYAREQRFTHSTCTVLDVVAAYKEFCGTGGSWNAPK